jgi:hypothetical protein
VVPKFTGRTKGTKSQLAIQNQAATDASANRDEESPGV